MMKEQRLRRALQWFNIFLANIRGRVKFCWEERAGGDGIVLLRQVVKGV